MQFKEHRLWSATLNRTGYLVNNSYLIRGFIFKVLYFKPPSNYFFSLWMHTVDETLSKQMI